MHHLFVFSGIRRGGLLWRHAAILSKTHYSNKSDRSNGNSDQVLSPLAITLPDLAPHEQAYIRSQLSYINTLNTDYLRKCSWEHAESLVRQDFPRFLTGAKKKPSDRLYRHLTKSVILTQRTSRALKNLGIDEAEIVANPSLLCYPLTSLPRDAQVKHMLDIRLESVVKKRRVEPLRSSHVRDIIEDLVATLNALEMSDQVVAFDGVRLSPRNKGVITLEELNQRAVMAFVKGCFPEDFLEHAVQILKTNAVSLVDFARNVDKNCAPIPSVNAKVFIRNYWLFHKLVGDDVFSKKMFRALCLFVCPLETLITLNDLYSNLSKYNEQLTVSGFMAEFSKNAMHNLLMPSLKFPLSLRLQLLMEIGFSPKEAGEILLSKHKSFSEHIAGSKKIDQLRFSSPAYIPHMQRRLQVLRSDGNTLGITTPADAFSAMTNWPSILNSVKMIREQNLQGVCLHYVNNAHGIKINATAGYRSISTHPAFEVVCNYLNCETEEEKLAVRKDLFVAPNQKAIPVSRVLNSLACLEKFGFSKIQVRNALPLLFYPTTLIEQQLKEMSEMPEFSNWDAEKGDKFVLHCCLYFLEKQFHFSKDGFWAGLQMDFSKMLYDELEKELGYVCKDKQTLMTPHPQAKASHILPPVAQILSKKVVGSYQLQGVCHFSTSSTQDLSGFPGRAFFLQNPFKMMRIHSEFKKLRAEWDPNMDKNSFLEATKQAVATVTQLIKESNYDDLKGLLSSRERERLKLEVETHWSDVRKNNVALDVEEVVLAVPERVLQQNVAYQKFCDIDVVFVAMKVNKKSTEAPILPMKISARFHRDYTEGRLPDWVITKFEVEPLVVE